MIGAHCFAHKINLVVTTLWQPPIVVATLLDAQVAFFTVVMHNNGSLALEEHVTENPLSMLWRKLGVSPMVSNYISKYLKLAQSAHV